ncbi:MAG TPA: hypothetical protein PLT66_02195 [Bacillota bacterium]|nr:hypothetical protein [Bacillota bacterium]
MKKRNVVLIVTAAVVVVLAIISIALYSKFSGSEIVMNKEDSKELLSSSYALLDSGKQSWIILMCESGAYSVLNRTPLYSGTEGSTREISDAESVQLLTNASQSISAALSGSMYSEINGTKIVGKTTKYVQIVLTAEAVALYSDKYDYGVATFTYEDGKLVSYTAYYENTLSAEGDSVTFNVGALVYYVTVYQSGPKYIYEDEVSDDAS